jgi:hypothetical protein
MRNRDRQVAELFSDLEKQVLAEQRQSTPVSGVSCSNCEQHPPLPEERINH